MNSKDIRSELERRRSIVMPLIAEISALERQLDRAVSVEYIAANQITHDQVETTDGDHKPWFNHFSAFGKWLTATDCNKPWAEWNGRLYRTSDVKLGRMDANAIGRYDDLPE